MGRRQLMPAALSAIALWAAWWLLSDGLSAEERRLVGTWRYRKTANGPLSGGLVLLPDGQFRTPIGGPGWWYVWDGDLVLDHEPSQLKRAVRPVLSYLGLPVVGPARSGRLRWVSEDEVVLYFPGGQSSVFVRVHTD